MRSSPRTFHFLDLQLGSLHDTNINSQSCTLPEAVTNENGKLKMLAQANKQ
jgi:hypothetical protein